MAAKEILEGLKDDMYSHDLSVTGRLNEYRHETDFPIDCFPAVIQDILIGLRESMGYQIDYSGIAMMTAAATAIGSSTRIQNFNNWTEPCILFTVIVGQSGTNKSHPLRAMLKPLLDIDSANYEKYKAEYAEYERKMQQLSGKKDDDSVELPQRPIRRQIIVEDVTMEALLQIIYENPRGLCLYYDEFGAFYGNMDRYTHGSSEQTFLSLFNGKPISMNRKGEKMSMLINAPFITITGTIQPDIIADLMDGKRSKSGILERLYFSCPKKEIFPLWKDLRKRSSNNHYQQWDNIIKSLYNESIKRLSEGGMILTLSEEACDALDQWQQKNMEKLSNATNGNIRDMYSKASIYILRFCLLLNELSNVCLGTEKRVVSSYIVERATKLAEYFIQNSVRVISLIYHNSLKEDEKDIFEALPEEFRYGDGLKVATGIASNWYDKKFKRFLDRHNNVLFSNVSHGIYRKLL